MIEGSPDFSTAKALAIRVAIGIVLASTASCIRPLPKFLSAEEFIPPAMRAMCEKDGGINIYKRVSGVRGVYLAGHIRQSFADPANPGPMTRSNNEGCAGCVSLLTQSYYEFVEAAFAIPIDPDGKPIRMDRRDSVRRLVDGPGLYRYTLEKKGHSDCALYRESLPLGPGVSRRMRGLIGQTHCIASTSIDAVSARYEEESRWELVWFDDIARVIRYSHLFRDRQTGEILAEAVQYTNWRRDNPRSPKTKFRCPMELQHPPIEEILVPHRSSLPD